MAANAPGLGGAPVSPGVTIAARGPRRGEIWLAHLPGQPDDPHQPRPVIIISVDARNRSTDDVIAIPIFSKGRVGPTRVRLPTGAGGIRHESVVFCDELTTIDHDYLESGPLGPPINPFLLDRIVQAVLNSILP